MDATEVVEFLKLLTHGGGLFPVIGFCTATATTTTSIRTVREQTKGFNGAVTVARQTTNDTCLACVKNRDVLPCYMCDKFHIPEAFLMYFSRAFTNNSLSRPANLTRICSTSAALFSG